MAYKRVWGGSSSSEVEKNQSASAFFLFVVIIIVFFMVFRYIYFYTKNPRIKPSIPSNKLASTYLGDAFVPIVTSSPQYTSDSSRVNSNYAQPYSKANKNIQGNKGEGVAGQTGDISSNNKLLGQKNNVLPKQLNQSSYKESSTNQSLKDINSKMHYKPYSVVKRSTPPKLNYLPITGSFWVLDYPDVDGQRTVALLDDMRTSNIDTIIISGVGGLAKKQDGTYYIPWGGTLFERNNGKVIKKVLQYAQAHNMRVWIGLLTHDPYEIQLWRGSPSDPKTDMGALLQFSYNAAEQAYQKAKEWGIDWNRTIEGFYVPEEKPVSILANNKAPDLIFFRALASYLHQHFPGKKVGVSPYLFERTNYNTAKKGFINLYNAGYDVIYPQDSIGSGLTKTFASDLAHMRALYDARVATGKRAWVNIELFHRDNNGVFVPTSIDTLKQQIYTAYPFADKLVCWTFSWGLSTTPALKNLQSYTNQYVAGRLEMRQRLKHSYVEYYKTHRVLHVFIYGKNLVIRGYGLAPRTKLKITINGKAWVGDVNFSKGLYYDLGYIPLSSLSDKGIKKSDLIHLKPWDVVVWTDTIFSNPPTPTPIKPDITSVFVYGNTLVIKGFYFGNNATLINIHKDAHEFGGLFKVYKEKYKGKIYDTVYILKSRLAKYGIRADSVNKADINLKIGDKYHAPNIKYVFKWGDTLVIKGPNFYASAVKVYIGQGGHSFVYVAHVFHETHGGNKEDVIYIPLNKFSHSGIDYNKLKLEDISMIPY